MLRTPLACLFAAVELWLLAAVAATSAQRDRPEFAHLFNSPVAIPINLLILCTPEDGCVSQNGDAMICTGVDVYERTLFLRTIAYPPDYSAYNVVQQFALPNSFVNTANFERVFGPNGQGNGNANANANGFGNGNGNQQPPPAPAPSPQQPPPDQQLGFNAFGGPSFRAAADDANPVHFEVPVSVKQYSLRMGNGIGVGATPPGHAPPPPDPVCRVQLVAAFGNPFGVCCGACR